MVERLGIIFGSSILFLLTDSLNNDTHIISVHFVTLFSMTLNLKENGSVSKKQPRSLENIIIHLHRVDPFD